jgi:hypothetical protein
MKRTLPLIAALFLAACKPQAPCLKSHTEMIWLPMIVGKVTVMRMQPVTRCDEHCAVFDKRQPCLQYVRDLKKWNDEQQAKREGCCYPNNRTGAL